jgi:predicted nucleic acid-binding protein
MTTNCVDDWEDDWENTDIPDLIVTSLEETIKNRERELKILEERKRMEEADLALSEELFDEEKRNKRTNESLALL